MYKILTVILLVLVVKKRVVSEHSISWPKQGKCICLNEKTKNQTNIEALLAAIDSIVSCNIRIIDA